MTSMIASHSLRHVRTLTGLLTLLLPFTVHANPPPAAAASLPGLSQPSTQDFSLRDARARLKFNRDISLAREQIKVAEGDRLSARVTPPSTLSLNTSSINTHTGIGGGAWRDRRMDSTLRLDTPFERGGKRTYREEAAEAALQATRQELGAVTRQQWLAIESAYWDVKLAQSQLSIAETNLALQRQTYAATEKRWQAGDISRLEADRLRVEARRAETDYTDAVARLRVSRRQLANLLSMDDQAPINATDPWPANQAYALAADALEQLPELQAARARVAEARARLELARAQGKADITVGVQYERTPTDLVNVNTYGVGVSLPLFMGERAEGGIRRASAELTQAEQQLERLRAGLQAELAVAQANHDAARQRLQLQLDEILPAAERVAQAAELARVHGAIGLLELLDARRTLLAARQDTEQARADFARSRAQLQALLGPQP